jgi:PRTRC genetic system protein C
MGKTSSQSLLGCPYFGIQLRYAQVTNGKSAYWKLSAVPTSSSRITGKPETNSLVFRNSRKALRGRTDTRCSSFISTTASSLGFIIVTITQSRFHNHFGEIKMATTTLKASSLPREFVFNGSRIPDPDPQMSIDQVRDLLTPSYPEIATATMTGPEDT